VPDPLYMKTLLTVSLFLFSLATQAQVVSRFTWSSTPLTKAAIGPNGTSVSPTATSDYIGGALGYALNPGLPTTNVNLIVPGASFDMNSMDLDFYFRREESVASFFKRGSLFEFAMNGGYLTMVFTTTQGSTPGNITINSGNIVTVADDHQFHHYRFRYDNSTGVANMWVDATIVYTYTGVAGRPLAWTGAGDVIIGENMDATSRNIAILSNLTVQYANSSLPVNLTSFEGTKKENKTLLLWNTAGELGFSHFIVERSADEKQFSQVATVTSHHTAGATAYHWYDEAPLTGDNYYRLKMVDADGKSEYSKVIKINFAPMLTKNACFPNPAKDHIFLNVVNGVAGEYDFSVSNMQGNILKSGKLNLQNGLQQVKIDLANNIPSGNLVLRVFNRKTNNIESFRIIK
jgi:hypothetical protein